MQLWKIPTMYMVLLMDNILSLGIELLIRELPFILDGSAKEKAQPQDDSKATLAPKVLCISLLDDILAYTSCDISSIGACKITLFSYCHFMSGQCSSSGCLKYVARWCTWKIRTVFFPICLISYL